MAYDSLSSQQQELLDLLRNEIAEYVGSEPSDLWSRPEIWQRHFESLNNQLEHLSRASQIVGLQGFGLSCDQLMHILRFFAKTQEAPSLALQHLIVRWPIIFLGYLQAILAGGFTLSASDELLAYLCLDEWPVRLTSNQKTIIIAAFEASDVIVDDHPEDLYPLEVTSEYACLNIPADVHPELLDGLLTELPIQSESFFTAIDHYIHTHDASYLLTAQRIAHTIKGASNVVGIKGVANLMHYCEDLLEIHQKGIDFGSANFSGLLQDVADCLANITDFLQGFAPAPDNIQSLLVLLVASLRDDVRQSSNAMDRCLSEQKQREDDTDDTKPIPTNDALKGIADKTIIVSDAYLDSPLVDNALIDELELTDIFHANMLTEIDGLIDADIDADIPISHILAVDSISKLETESSQNFADLGDSARPLHPREVDELPANERSLFVPNAPMLKEDLEAKPQFNLTISDEKAAELLRVAGEVQISNTQIQSRVDSAVGVVESTLRFQQQLLDLADELDKSLAQQSSAFVAANAGDDSDMDPLELERYHELHSFASRLQEVTTDAFEAAKDTEQSLTQLQDIIAEQRRLGFTMQHHVLSIRLLPASVLSSRFTRAVRQAARLTQKSVSLDIIGDEVLVDSRVLNAIADPILHLLRNAVDHGLESTAADRLASNKSAEGKITLAFSRVGEAIQITVSDDGRGIDYQAIEKIAIERGIVNAEKDHSNAELNRVILMPGFSTRSAATQISGRGIGLDVVSDQVRQLKGRLSIISEQSVGTSFELFMPMSVLSAHLLIVTCANQLHGVMSRGLQQIAYLQSGELKQTDQKQWYYDLYGEEIPVFFLNEMVGAEVDSEISAEQYTALLITRKADGELCGVAVEHIKASEEHVIKPLGRFTYRPSGVTGAAILGSGVIAPILDIHDFPVLRFTEEERQHWQQRVALLDSPKNRVVATKPVALVVDDSLSARRALAQFMADFGYEVIAARDGFDAIHQMADLPENKIPMIALVDLEMPRMNGLELAAHMRSQPAYESIPIAMVTSRTTARHKLMAKTAGVNAYVNKPWSDDELTQMLTDLIPQDPQVANA